MGPFDKLSSIFGTNREASRKDQIAADGDSNAGTEETVEETVNELDRTEIIATYYDVSHEQARRITDIIQDHLTDEGGYSNRDILQEIQTNLEIADDLAERIVYTEVGSIQVIDTIETYQNRPDADEHLFKLVAPSDHRTHPICEEVKEQVEAQGGGVPLDELQRLLREKAEQYSDEGGTPERMDHWVAYEKFRYTVNRHVEW
jgi:hypothetical protein